MKHLVIDDVFEGVAGNAGLIEDAADHNRIMRGIIVAQAVARMVLTPG
jgi:hypothetical protein